MLSSVQFRACQLLGIRQVQVVLGALLGFHGKRHGVGFYQWLMMAAWLVLCRKPGKRRGQFSL